MPELLSMPLPDDVVIVWEFDLSSYTIHAGLVTATAENLEAALKAARRFASEASEILVRRADRTIQRLLGCDIDVVFGRQPD